MIKIDKTTNKITTDCMTVGEFMTEAAAMFYYCVIIVDGCRCEFIETPKVRVTDDTPIGSVTMDGNGDIFITTKLQPKTDPFKVGFFIGFSGFTAKVTKK